MKAHYIQCSRERGRVSARERQADRKRQGDTKRDRDKDIKEERSRG
jgi:hypothetical protein